jgi:hypothetical protein
MQQSLDAVSAALDALCAIALLQQAWPCRWWKKVEAPVTN